MVSRFHDSKRLAGYLDWMIYFKDFIPPSPVERLVPTTGFFLVLELDGMTRRIMDNRDLSVIQEVERGWISGLQKQYRTISAHEASEMLIVSFRPLHASGFIPGSLSDYENRIVPADSVYGPAFVRLHGDLMRPSPPEAKFKLMEDWLLARHRPVAAVVRELEKLIVRLQGDPFADLASALRDYPHSHRQLIADFRKHVGTTPKFFQRILRFQSLLTSIEKKEVINWSELAFQGGFSDQSHLIREFQFFSGFVPTEFLDRKFHCSGTNFFPLVKKRQDGDVDPG